jgi:GT2 family glycosyltransferase
MDLSVVIVNYNAAPFIAGCLTSLVRHVRSLTYEVCVVDNASTDNSCEFIRERFPWVKLVDCDRNLGFAAGVNRGVNATSGRHLLWLNPDSVLLDDGFESLVSYLDDHPAVGVLGAQLLDAEGTIQLSCRSFPSYSAVLGHRYSVLTRLFPTNRWSLDYLRIGSAHDAVEDVDWVSGACLLHPRKLLSSIGGLDDQFFMYCEDVDFCLRVRQAGFAVQYHPGARVRHYIGASSRSAKAAMVVARHRSMWRYYRKHFHRTPVTDCAVGAAIAARCGLKMLEAATPHYDS